MASALYSRKILRLAASLLPDDAVNGAQGSADMRAALCGSRVQADIILAEGHVEALAFRVNACALGQASAALLRQHAVGMTFDALTGLRAMLASGLMGDDMPDIWPEFVHFEPARAHSSRHGAILLPYDALITAFEQAQGKERTRSMTHA